MAIALEVFASTRHLEKLPQHHVCSPIQKTQITKGREIDRWAQALGIHEDFEQAIVAYDLVFVLLGDKYLRALDLPVKTDSEQTLIFLASKKSTFFIRFLNANTKSFILTLSNAEASRFGYGLVGLKGYLFKLFATEAEDKPDLLQRVYQEPKIFLQFVDKQLH
ncbi:hypothetical protein NUACC21_27660 [Scytonema sp. NUACC21]